MPPKAWRDENFSILCSEFSPEQVRQIARSLREGMVSGEKDALRHLPYIFGSHPQEVKHSGDNDAPIKLIVEYVGGDSDTDDQDTETA